MIAIESESGELIKVLSNFVQGEYGFHKTFGFVSKKCAQERVDAHKRQGYDFVKNEWLCSFGIKRHKNEIIIDNAHACSIRAFSSGWILEAPNGNFKLIDGSKYCIESAFYAPMEDYSQSTKLAEKVFLALFLSFPIIVYLTYKSMDKTQSVEEIKPLTVKIIKPVEKVTIPREQNKNKDIKVKPLSKEQISKRAVKRNLGFLGLVGSKTVKNAVGGTPQKLAKATAGAGVGGDAGSGGEVLSNLGKGLKKTTVGNTGVKGLGGKLVTKGTAGGGKGGYGNTLVASGTGGGISKVGVTASDMVLEGGISRFAINATIAKYLNQVRRCYETQLKTKPNIQGLVQMSFEIGPNGMLNFARVKRSSLNDPLTEKCIQQKMMTWEFPKPKGGVNVPVKYPFMLRPVGQ